MISGTSWTHLLARPLVRPLIGTWVRPNHLTTLRLLTGVAACVAVAWGSRAGLWWGGGLWLVSAFLDRADGELARMGQRARERAVERMSLADSVERMAALMTRLVPTSAPQREISAVLSDSSREKSSGVASARVEKR